MKYLIIISLLILTSCKADLERLLGIHEWKTYHIPQGKHESSGIHVATLSTYHLDFKARFDETCIYDLHSKDQNDINKLSNYILIHPYFLCF